MFPAKPASKYLCDPRLWLAESDHVTWILASDWVSQTHNMDNDSELFPVIWDSHSLDNHREI